jgi:hypothetical protein
LCTHKPFDEDSLRNGCNAPRIETVLTDRPPGNPALLAQFLASDRLRQLDLPQDNRLREQAKSIEYAIKGPARAALLQPCAQFLTAASDFFQVKTPDVRILAARPLRVREGDSSELFADYSPETMLIRIWSRTAVRKQVTSFGTFFSTLCHEFCHHLDCQRLGFPRSPHTRGFYERTAVLYHHARGTPPRRLVWVQLPRSRWRIDWQRMNRGEK